MNAQERLFRSQWQYVAGGLHFPEGPAWSEKGLFVSNCYSDWIARWHKGRLDTLRLKNADSVRTNGLTFYHGLLYACDFGKKQVIQVMPDGRWITLTAGIALQRPNDLTFDSWGDLYFTDSGDYSHSQPNGAVWCVHFTSGKRVEKVLDQLAFPNGIAFAPKGDYLYITESARQQIVRFRRLSRDKFGPGEKLIDLPGGDPDGLAFDEEGNLYVAHFGAGHVWVIAPDGSILEKIKTPGKKPSNLEFGGSDLRTLFLTEDETNAIYSIKTVNRGVAIH